MEGVVLPGLPVALAASQQAWPFSLLLTVWWVLRTRIVRTAAWSWFLHRQGVAKTERRKLITDAAQRDLDIGDPP